MNEIHIQLSVKCFVVCDYPQNFLFNFASAPSHNEDRDSLENKMQCEIFRSSEYFYLTLNENIIKIRS